MGINRGGMGSAKLRQTGGLRKYLETAANAEFAKMLILYCSLSEVSGYSSVGKEIGYKTCGRSHQGTTAATQV